MWASQLPICPGGLQRFNVAGAGDLGLIVRVVPHFGGVEFAI